MPNLDAVGKKCNVCWTTIQRMDMVFIGQLSGKVFHQDCYEVVERHQQLAGMLQKGGITKNVYSELQSNKDLKIIDYELNRR